MTEDTVSRPDPFREQADAYHRLSEEYIAFAQRARAIEEAARAVVTFFCSCGPDIILQGHERDCLQREPEMKALRAALEGAPHDPE